MMKVCKIRIYPNKTQETIIFKTLDACRFVYNLYIEYCKKTYEDGNGFLSGYDFAKIITKLKKEDDKYYWLDGVSTKAIKDSIMNAEKAFLRFFDLISNPSNKKKSKKKKKNTGFPNFKSKKKNPVTSFFFIKDNIRRIQSSI